MDGKDISWINVAWTLALVVVVVVLILAFGITDIPGWGGGEMRP